MRVTTGKVIEGKVVVEGLPLEEGAVVTVLAREAEETFRLSPEEEAELLLSIEEADRGETVSLEEVLERLPGPGLDGGIWLSASSIRRMLANH